MNKKNKGLIRYLIGVELVPEGEKEPQFTFDPAKSAANLEKHGIDFEEAQALWEDRCAIEYAVEHTGEQRYCRVSRYAGSYWAVFFTMRGDAVRIISVRRATRGEISRYDRENNDR